MNTLPGFTADASFESTLDVYSESVVHSAQGVKVVPAAASFANCVYWICPHCASCRGPAYHCAMLCNLCSWCHYWYGDF